MKLLISGKECNFFTNGSITLKLDSIASTFEFSARFSAQNKEHQEMFKPLQYKDVEIFNSKDRLIFTGTILNHSFKSNQGRELVVISGYSKSGILEDVTIPLNAYPLENNNSSFLDIAKRLCGLFGIGVVVSEQSKSISESTVNTNQKNIKEKSTFESIKARANSIFGRTSAEPTETIKDYLSKLAGQKNIILSHNEKGEVLIFQPSYNQKPRYFFTKGNSLSMSADFNGQALHSEISVIRQPSDDNEGVSTTDKITNPLVAKYRPTTKILSSGGDTETKDSANNELAYELKSINVGVELQGLFDEIYPGEIVNVHNHYIYCYAYNRFMVDTVTLKFDEKEERTTLGLVVPETFNGNETVRNILFNHHDEDNHIEPHLNEEFSTYTNRQDIL